MGWRELPRLILAGKGNGGGTEEEVADSKGFLGGGPWAELGEESYWSISLVNKDAAYCSWRDGVESAEGTPPRLEVGSKGMQGLLKKRQGPWWVEPSQPPQ